MGAGFEKYCFLAMTGLGAGCHPSTSAQVFGAFGQPSVPFEIHHEKCDETVGKAESIDTNADGKPDIVRYTVNGREVCRVVDIDHNGRPDEYIYFDQNGSVRRRESDYDGNGAIDEVTHYANGVIVSKDRRLNLPQRFDTWDSYENGKLVRRLRDSQSSGRIDERWTWPDPNKPDCATIARDRNGSGRPDPDQTQYTCASSTTSGSK